MKIFKNKFFQFGLAVFGGVILYILIGQSFIRVGASFLSAEGLETATIFLARPASTAPVGLLVQSGRTGINIGTSTVPGTRLHINGVLRVDPTLAPFALPLIDSPFLGSITKSFLPINLNGVNYYAEIIRGDASHTFNDCTAVPGTVVSNNGFNFCKIAGSSCPSGWTAYGNWSETVAKSCGAVGVTYPGVCFSSCSTGSHGFSDRLAETCTYYDGSCVYGHTCYSLKTFVGCY